MINNSAHYLDYKLKKSKPGALLMSLFVVSISVYICLPKCVFSQSKKPAVSSISQVRTTTLSFSDTTKKTDRDGDGVIDSLDKCPDEKGVIQYDGCPVPDSDNDGVADDIDACPTVAGLAKYKGCPPPDTDGDKINDEDDKCPTIPGVARYDGCPVGDRDGDGINDDDDKCIDVPGTIKNFGCPETKKTTTVLPKFKRKSK